MRSSLSQFKVNEVEQWGFFLLYNFKLLKDLENKSVDAFLKNRRKCKQLKDYLLVPGDLSERKKSEGYFWEIFFFTWTYFC